jgi:hypothetical protein
MWVEQLCYALNLKFTLKLKKMNAEKETKIIKTNSLIPILHYMNHHYIQQKINMSNKKDIETAQR